jgi:uncharacterized protein YwbE
MMDKPLPKRSEIRTGLRVQIIEKQNKAFYSSKIISGPTY